MAVVSRSATTYTRHYLIRHEFDRKTKTCVANNSLCYSAKKAPPPQRIVGGRRVIVAASPPTEDAVVATDPLTKQDLVDYLASGCKPKDKWRFRFFFFLCFFFFFIFVTYNHSFIVLFGHTS